MLKIWPIVQYEGQWSVPDEVLFDMWMRMVDSGRDKEVFYDGFVKNAGEWVNHIKNPNNFVVLVVIPEKKQVVGFGWLNNIYDGTGEAHFCYLNRVIPKAGKMVLDYWEDNLPIKVIVGYTPKSYGTVLRLLNRWGFKRGGKIPQYCDMIYKDKREEAIISYYLTGGKDNGKG